jgi:hypothetical protein
MAKAVRKHPRNMTVEEFRAWFKKKYPHFWKEYMEELDAKPDVLRWILDIVIK